MTTAEQEAILFIALRAAFADGGKDERERAEIRRIAEAMPAGPNVAALYQDALLGPPDARAGRRRARRRRSCASTPSRWRSACATPTAPIRRPKRRSSTSSAPALGLDAARGEAFAAQAAAVAGAPLAPVSAVEPPYAATMTGAEMDRWSSTTPSSTGRSSCCRRASPRWRSFRCR